MATANGQTPESVYSLLDTDLYKLTMQCAILKYFPEVLVTYALTNRTPSMKLTREAYIWLDDQIEGLGKIRVTDNEIEWLRKTCPYLSEAYLDYLREFQLRPREQVVLEFRNSGLSDEHHARGEISIEVRGLWVETILYEIPLLALVSEAYFKFVDKDWAYDGQLENAKEKGLKLLENGCVFSEFGSRRRRDYKTHETIMRGLVDSSTEMETNGKGWKGKFTGTSNVHFAMKLGLQPIGTVAHEWFMAIAAIADDYANANELAMQYWIGTFGRGTLAIALTDTFGTPAFLKSFTKPAPNSHSINSADSADDLTYAQVFTGVRQDSGDPLEYLELMSTFYKSQGITDKKMIVYSDSLNTGKCIQYRKATEEAGLTASFGIGTFFTNDFRQASKPEEKSVPLNIVIKLSSANGHPAVKLSDNVGKNMGDQQEVGKVKKVVEYEEREWKEGDEAHRWDK